LVAGPIAAFDQNVREQRGDGFLRRQFVEDHHGIDAFQRGQDFGAFVFRENWASRTFQLADAMVAVEADDEHVAELACGFERADMPRMEKIEAAIGEDYFVTDRTGARFVVVFAAAKPQNRFFQRKNFGTQRISMRTPGAAGREQRETPVYHASAAGAAARHAGQWIWR